MNASDLTSSQWGMLVSLRHAGPRGFEAAERDGVLRALERRKLAEYRPLKATPRVRRWFATVEGCDLVDAAAAEASRL